MDRHIAFAYALTDGRALGNDDEIARAIRSDEPAWLHLRADHEDTPAWIDRNLTFFDEIVRDALTEPETRPRATRVGDGLLVILRTINFQSGEDPEDMLAIRLWVGAEGLVSLSRRDLRAVDLLRQRIDSGRGPHRTGSVLARLVERIVDEIEFQVADLDERTERLEAAMIETADTELSAEVSDQRLELTELRRFLVPQRDAIRDMLRYRPDWLQDGDVRRLDEQYDQITRVLETLDAVREQLYAIRDELENARATRLNRNLYVLSVISAIFLPLGFFTGLMGINLDGMPGATWDAAFWVFSGGLVALAAGLIALLKLMRIL